MSRIITFSRVFPSYHPRAGEPTYFIEKIVSGLVSRDVKGCGTELIKSLRDSKLLSISVLNELHKGTFSFEKHHTIRAGHRWKVGDKFSPRVWSGIPYNSKQIHFAPDIEVKKIFDFDITGTDCALNGRLEYALTGEGFDFEKVAFNDGLSGGELYDWFTMSPEFKRKNEFHGQIISWNENINY